MNDQRPDDDRQIFRLRVIGVVVTLSLMVLLVLVDTFGRLLVDREFRVSDTIFFVLSGVFLTLLGIEGAARLFKRG